MANNINDLLSELSNILNEATKMPLAGGKCLVEKSTCLDIVYEIEDALPVEIKHATMIVQSKNEILENAKAEAKEIVRQAEERAKILVSESEIIQAAKRKGTELVKQAEDKATQVRKTTEEAVAQLRATAEATAEQQVNAATAKAKDIRRGTFEYVDDTLRRLEEAYAYAGGEMNKMQEMVGAVGSDLRKRRSQFSKTTRE